MAEPLLTSDHLVAAWDPDARGWNARDFVPGPAGSAGLELPGGIEVDVDGAAPFTLAGLWIPESADRGIVEALLGSDRARSVLGTHDDAPHLLPGDELGRRRYQAGTDPRRQRGVDEDLARLALVGTLTTDPASSLVRGLVALDEATAAVALADRLPLGDRAAASAALAAELLLDAARTGALYGRPVPSVQLAELLWRIVPLLDPALATRVRRLAEDVGRGAQDLLDDAPVAAAAAPAMAPARAGAAMERAVPAPVAPLLDVIDRRVLPAPFAGAAVVARATTPSEIELRISGRASDAGGWWVRAFGADDVVMAVAPLRVAGRDAVARLLIPPALLRDVEVDVTATPAVPRPGRRLRGVADAVALGRTAARADRLGDQQQANRRWRETSQAWDEVGDQPRAGLANEYATGMARRRRGPVAPMPPLLADAVLEAGG